jgi:hypothetical protein
LKRIAKEKEEPNFKKYIHEQKIETSWRNGYYKKRKEEKNISFTFMICKSMTFSSLFSIFFSILQPRVTNLIFFTMVSKESRVKLRSGYIFFESKDCFFLKLLMRWWWIKLDFEDKGNMYFFQALKQSTKLAPIFISNWFFPTLCTRFCKPYSFNSCVYTPKKSKMVIQTRSIFSLKLERLIFIPT